MNVLLLFSCFLATGGVWSASLPDPSSTEMDSGYGDEAISDETDDGESGYVWYEDVLPEEADSDDGNAEGSGRKKRSVLSDPNKRWPKGVIPYQIDPYSYTPDEILMINEAIRQFKNKTCLQYVPKNDSYNDYIYFKSVNGGGCSSWIGRRTGRQEVHLESGRCFVLGTVMHEMLHAAGFIHEHTRPDYAQFITINRANIEQSKKHNFNPYNPSQVDDKGVGYDYDSVMHYPPSAFAKNRGQPTITPIRQLPPGVAIGQRRGLSQKDILKINLVYC